jgi:phosphoribosylaminoimidazole-succinocarboxamide synthase
VLPSGDLLLIDEALTPTRLAYWPRDQYEPGRPQPSFDKQFVRDFPRRHSLEQAAPGPGVPGLGRDGTRDKYLEAFRRLTGHDLPWP